jgi:hypothetical protein
MKAATALRRRLGYWSHPAVLSAALVLLASGFAVAAGGEKAAAIVVVADMRGLSGWQLWLADLYNRSSLGFAAFTVVVIPLAGAILGLLADVVMKRIGIDLTRRELAEH